MSESENRKNRKTVVGLVTSSKMDKTIVVQVQRRVLHPVFKKYMQRRTKYYAHDENNEAGKGDRVQIMETRPLSKSKSFRLVKIVEKARIPASTPEVDTGSEVGGE